MEIIANLNPLIYLYLLLLSINIAAIFFLNKTKPFSRYKLGCLLFSASAYWLLFYIFELASRSLKLKIFWGQVQYPGIALIPVLFFLLTIYFSGYKNILTARMMLPFLIIPVAALFFVFSNEFHHLFWRNTALLNFGEYVLMDIKYGPVFYVFMGYNYLLSFVGFVFMLGTLVRKIKLFMLQSIVLIVALLITIAANIIYIFQLLPFKHFDITPFAITLSCIILVYGIIKLKIGDIFPVKQIPAIDEKKDFSVIVNNFDVLLFISPIGLKILGTDLKSIVGKNIMKIIPDSAILEKIKQGDARGKNTISFGKGGIEEIFDVSMSPLAENRNSIVGKIFIFENITEKIRMQEELEASEKRYRGIFENSLDGIFQATIDGKFIDVNPAFARMLGYKNREELLLKNLRTEIFCHEKDIPEMKSGGVLFETRLRKKNKAQVWVELNTRAVEVNGIPLYFEGIVRDISSRKQAEEEIKYISFHDQLTGLYNRHFFEEELNRLDSSRFYPASLIISDINGLKLVNDAFGRSKGDEILIEAAKIFRQCFRKEDIVARWGGDEFCIILTNTDEKTASEIITRVQDKFARNFIDYFKLSLSFGVATKTSSALKYEKIIKIAEDKMFSHKMLNKQSIHSNIITSLCKALEERNYETHEHTLRTRRYAILIGKKLDLDPSSLDELELLASLHDIGKISIPDNIILKAGKLTKEEFETIKKHSEIGYNIANSTPELKSIAKGILTHQEKWDGTGYPLNLKGEEIPLNARIISVVDAFDAMTNDRPYRKAMDINKAIEELRTCSGSQFDKNIVEKFLEILGSYSYDLDSICNDNAEYAPN